MNGLLSVASMELQSKGTPENDGRPKEKSENKYNIYNLIDYLQKFENGSKEKLAGDFLKQFMALELQEQFRRKVL